MIDRLFNRACLRRWRRAAGRAGALDLGDLRDLNDEARRLQRVLGRVRHEAEGRLALPGMGANTVRRPASADWAWRPEAWRGPLPLPGVVAVADRTRLGAGATIFHDCKQSELIVRQLRNTREDDLAPFGLRMEIFRFEGSFLSLVLALPDEAAQGLRRRHILRMNLTVEVEQPLGMFARLNIRHGPNTEQIVRELPRGRRDCEVEFDLAYTKMNEKRVEGLWVDLLFEQAEMNQITLRDVTFCRRPRAEL